jgi:hypothetical protein
MPKEIDVSSYECDCGHQLHFFENTIREMKQISYRRREGIGEGSDRHAAIFHRGAFVAMYCPKAGKEIPVRAAASREVRRLQVGGWTPRQGQVLAFIHLYTKLNRRPPAEADIAKYMGVTAPSAHQMVMTLERKGLIWRESGTARSIAVRVDRSLLPALE